MNKHNKNFHSGIEGQNNYFPGIPESFTQKTKQVWRPYLRIPITTADAITIIINMCGFFEALNKPSKIKFSEFYHEN